ncbi:MAG: EamA family transporter [Alphaproteobacteria bacterium]|nr:EamA family transporter [Alphaproteobacteria bacterium]
MAWFIFALGTAICWGAGYALTEKLLHSGLSGSLFLTILYALSLPVFLCAAWYDGTLKASLNMFPDMRLFLVLTGTVLFFALGNLLIMQAIIMKDASHANLIEITYPVFTILFTYLFFKNVHIDWTTALGGLLILGGAALIIYKGGT